MPLFKKSSRQVAAHSSSWFVRCAVAGLLAAGFAQHPVRAATTTYTSVYAGGTISPGDTVLLNDGATVTGNVTDNGTLQFNQTGSLTISNTISGTGALSMTNTGTINLTGGSALGGGIALDMTTSAAAGLLQIRSGTGAFYVGYTGTGSLSVAGGNVTVGALTISNTSTAFGSVTVSSGTLTAANFAIGGNGTGTLNMTGAASSACRPTSATTPRASAPSRCPAAR